MTEKIEMEPSSDRLEQLRKEGFAKDFMIKDGYLTFDGSPVGYKPESVKIVSHYRFEGISDPADNSIVYAMETNDGHKGILTDAYGMYADEKTGKFIKAVEDIHKKESGDFPPVTDDKGSAKSDE